MILPITRGLSLKPRTPLMPKDPQRRAACAFDLNRFAMTYCSQYYRDPGTFQIEFCSRLQEMIIAPTGIHQQAIAAPRGIGKTTIVWIAILWAVLYSHRRVCVIIGANGDNAKDRLDAIKLQFMKNEAIHEDFPEHTTWVRGFGGDARCKPAGYAWADDEIKTLNDVWVVTKGIDCSIPGLLKDGKRPDLVLKDDLETVSSIRSKTETETIEQRVRTEILFLHGQGERCAYIMICTIRKAGCISDRFTDAEIEPSWRGRRYRGLIQWPTRTDQWDRFVAICKEKTTDVVDQLASEEETCVALCVAPELFALYTPKQQKALRFYVAHKVDMDAGAKLLDERRLPLHQCYLFISNGTDGPAAFASEIQNDPLKDENTSSRGIDVDYLLGRRIPGQPRGRVPVWADLLTVNIDVGMYRLHWQADAWNTQDETSMLVDEGIEETGVNDGGRHERSDDQHARRHMVTASIRAALNKLRLRCANGWPKDSGVMIQPMVGVDLGGQADEYAWLRTVLDFCRESGNWFPMRGTSWHESFRQKSGGRNWLFNQELGYFQCNADEYKLALMRAYNQPQWDDAGAPFPGTRLLFGACPTEYAKQMTAEIYITSFEPGKPSANASVARWHKLSQKNHYLDAAWNSRALMEIVRDLKPELPKQQSWYVPGAGAGIEPNEGPGAQEMSMGLGDPLMQ